MKLIAYNPIGQRFLLLCLLVLALPVLALLSHRLFAAPVQANDKTHFVIAVGQNSYPYQYANADGEAEGLLVDIWRLWAEKNAYTVEFKLFPWSKSLVELQTGQADFHAGMAVTQARMKTFLLGQALISARTNIFIHQQLNGINALADLKPYVVGIVEGSSHIAGLMKHLPGINLKTYPSANHLYQAALAGEVKVFTGLSRIRASHPDFNRLSQSFPLYKKITDQAFDLSYAVNLQNPALEQQIQRGLDKVPPEDIKQLERHWLGAGGESEAIVIALPIDMAPYMSVSAKGEPIGLFVDIWRKWAQVTQQKIVFLTDNTQLSMQNLIDNKADVHAAYADDAVNANLFAHAHHIYSFFSKVYYPLAERASPMVESDLANARLGILNSNPAKEALLKQFDTVELVFFNSRESMIEASLSLEIDGFVAAQEITNVYLIKRSLQNRFNAVADLRFESRVYSLVSKENKTLISQIKSGFSQVPISSLAEMENGWIEHSDSPYFATAQSKVDLTRAEKHWLLRHPVIRLGALRHWAPIEFIDDQGELIGVTADLMKIIEKRANVSIEVTLFNQWSQLLKALQNKNIDMIASMEKTVDRKNFATFTEGYWPSHWALILPSVNSTVNTVAQLKGKRLAVVKGYQLIPYLHQHFPQTLLQIVKDSQSGFAAVRQGKADAFIDGMVAAASELKEGEYRDLRFSLVEDIAPAMERIGVRDDWRPLVSILNKVIATVTADEKKAILETWFEIKIESGIDKEKVLQFGGLAIVILVLVLLWNRHLKAEVRLRREMELKMQHMATHDELTGLPNRGLLRDRLNTSIANHARHQELLALLFIDLDGFKAVNDTYGHDIGDELLIQIAERFDNRIRKTDTVARCGGDEFVILLTSLHHREEAAFICEKIISQAREPFVLSSCTVSVGASIGVAMYPDDGTDPETLVKAGDTLMYAVKTSGKNNFKFSDEKSGIKQTG